MIRFALGAKWGIPAARDFDGDAGFWAAAVLPSMAAKAICPKPIALLRKYSRRVDIGWNWWHLIGYSQLAFITNFQMIGGLAVQFISFDNLKSARAEQGLTGHCPGLLVGFLIAFLLQNLACIADVGQ